VAATKVYGYESGKVGEQFFTRPVLGQSAHALVQRARAEARKGDWLKRLSSRPASQPRVFIAPIAAGEKVVASKESDVFNFIRASYNDAIAVEMEGFGFLSAAFAYPNIKAIVIRSISDLIEDKLETDRKGCQEIAACHASAFAFEVLAKMQLQASLTQESLPITEQSSVQRSQGVTMNQNNSGKSKGQQVVVQGGTAYVGGEIHLIQGGFYQPNWKVNTVNQAQGDIHIANEGDRPEKAEDGAKGLEDTEAQQ
jgi:hypothetical protein